MRRLSVALLPLGVSLALAACTSDSDTTSRSITSVQRSSAGGPPSANACNVGDVKKAAQDAFASQQDPVFSLLNDLQSASDLAAATAIGWDIQRRVATARLTSAVDGTVDDLGLVVLGTFKCTSLASSVPSDFVNNLSLILSQGIFEVRGAGGSLPAAAWLTVNNARTLASPRWGVEPVSTWPTGSAFLVYGYPKLIAGTFVTPATAINTNGSGNYNGFELGSIPATQSKAGLRIGVCVAALNGTTVANRLIHAGAIQVNSSPTQLCTISLTSSSTFESLSRRLASFLTPKPLFAQGEDGRIGGLPSDWSPNTTGQLTGSDIAIKWTSTPNSNVGVPKNYVVNVTIAGVPVPGVVVSAFVSGNQGEPADAIILVPPSTTTATTDASGNATFILAFGKAGGYNLRATGSLDGVATQAGVTTKGFQIKN